MGRRGTLKNHDESKCQNSSICVFRCTFQKLCVTEIKMSKVAVKTNTNRRLANESKGEESKNHSISTVPRHLPIAHLPIRLLSSDFYPSHFYPSRLLPITGLSSKKDFYPLGHSPIRTFTHLFYFKHHKQRSKKRKLNSSLSKKKYFFHRHLPRTILCRYVLPNLVLHSHALSEGLIQG